MNAETKPAELTSVEKKLLFWASFLSLTAAGFGFAFRVACQGNYEAELGLTKFEVGQIFGAALWPIAITMIGFSLVVDKTGYKIPMFVAFFLQGGSAIGTYMADSFYGLYGFALCAGLGHGIVEAVINPACAAVYPTQKTKMLTILHAAWPAGLVFGTLFIIGADAVAGEGGMEWNYHALWMLLPVLAYGVMYIPCRFPIDERVQAGVPYMAMLKEVGFLSASIVAFMMIFEFGNQFEKLEWVELPKPATWFYVSLGAGIVVGAVFGLLVRGIGKPLFFLMCLLMIPVATAELATDGFIKDLMKPVLAKDNIDAAFAIVFSASIMLVLRVFAGGVLRFFSPPTLLAFSGLFSAIGLMWLSTAGGIAVFIAFVLYALGQTYYWPCVLGFVSERYPRGGALTLNTVSAIGLLSVGIIGGPILGMAFDRSIRDNAAKEVPTLAETTSSDSGFLWMEYKTVKPEDAAGYIAELPESEQGEVQAKFDKVKLDSGRDVLRFAAIFPGILVLSFGGIALYFLMQGGYKQIHLESVESAIADKGADEAAEM